MAGGNTATLHMVHFSGRDSGETIAMWGSGAVNDNGGLCWATSPRSGRTPRPYRPLEGGRIESMKKSTEKSVTWSNLRCSLNDLDRPALLDLIRDLYTVVWTTRLFFMPASSRERKVSYSTGDDRRWNGRFLAKSGDLRRQGDEGGRRLPASGQPEGLAELAVVY